METLKFDIKTTDGNCDCFAAFPADGKNYPAVLLLMDGYGPREYLYDMTKTLAAEGYYVLLPNLFYRRRRAPVIDAQFPITTATLPAARDQLMALFSTYDPEAGLQDTGEFLGFLALQSQVRPRKVGVTGYCMGGGLGLRTAAQYADRVGAIASFHGGRLATEAPTSPHRFLTDIQARVYIAHAEADASMPAQEIERLDSALKETSLNYETETYTGARHGFTMADLPAYNEAALRRHWLKLLELFEAELKP